MNKKLWLRLFIFSAFALATFYFIFLSGPKNSTFVSPTIYAANAGFPFYDYPTEIKNHSEIDKSRLTRFENGDSGLNIAISAVSVIGRCFGDSSFMVDAITVSHITLAIVLISGFLLIFSPLPIIVNLVSIFSLFLISLEVAPSFLRSDVGNSRWLVGIVPVLVLNLVLIFFSRMGKGKKFFHPIFIIYAVWLSFFGIIRQDASVFLYLFILFLCVFSLVRNNGRLIALFLFTPMIFNLLVRVSLTVAYERPLTKMMGMPSHGSGVPLYLGLGASNNPFNIAWQDEIAELHAPFYYTGKEHRSLQPILSGAFKKLVLTEPVEFIKGLYKKTVFLHHLFINSEIKEKDQAFFMAGFEIKKHFRYYYLLFLGFSLFLFGYLIFAKNTQLKVFLLAGYIISLGGFVGPILVYPGYPVSAMGSIVAICGLLAPLYFLRPIFEIKSLDSLIKMFKWSLAAGVAIGTFWVSAMALRVEYNLRRIRAGNPLALIQQMKFEYGHYFNRLSEVDKQGIVGRLKNAANAAVYFGLDHQSGILRPVAAVMDEKNSQLHLMVFLSRQWTPNLVEIDQGYVNSRIVVATSPVDLSYRKDIDFNRHLFIDIADEEWIDQIKFITFPVGKDFDFKAAKLFIKGYQRTSLDNTQPGGVMVKDVGSAELSVNL